MPRNGAGTFTRGDGTRQGSTLWDKNKIAGVKITTNEHDLHDQDIADAITQSVSKDGQTTMTGSLPMGGNTITGYGSDGEDVEVPVFSSTSPTFVNGAFTYATQTGQEMALGKMRWINYNMSATVSTQSGDLVLLATDAPVFETSVTLGALTIGGTKQNDISVIMNTFGQMYFKDSSGTNVVVPAVSTVILVNVNVVYRVA